MFTSREYEIRIRFLRKKSPLTLKGKWYTCGIVQGSITILDNYCENQSLNNLYIILNTPVSYLWNDKTGLVPRPVNS